MKRREVLLLVLLLCFIALSMLNILSIYYFPPRLFNPATGMGITGEISLYVEGGDKFVTIDSPGNITYDFGIGANYLVDLNVSANFNVDAWSYDLIDLKHGSTVYENVGFSPNITFSAVRWSNQITVYANDSGGNGASKVVIFFVNVPNSAPAIESIASNIYVCEGQSLAYYFNATDVDEDILTSDISPKNPFYTFPTLSQAVNRTLFQIISGVLGKGDVGGIDQGWKVYEESVSISDNYNSTCCSDSKETNITLIEINNAPVMENIGVQTVWTQGDNSTFYKQAQVTDLEDGDQDSGVVNFNVSFSADSLFNITQNGTMNFDPNESQVGVYNVTVCVNDTGIANPFEGILGNCSQDGGPIATCGNFSLTVTNENRVPTIIDNYPTNLSLSVSGTDSLYFNITEYDPDGTAPDAYWYVDGVFIELDSGNLIDEFSYNFGCGVSGTHLVNATITDGLLNDSIEWNLNVSYVVCPTTSPPGGGGGADTCIPTWVSEDWEVCQNTEISLKLGILSGNDYRAIKEQCAENDLDEKTCGFQIRNWFDLDNCVSSKHPLVDVQFCHYVEGPSCSDGVKNCHHGACEIFVDCGGPCSPCPSCSDGVKNQGEDGVDCGGPCPPCVGVSMIGLPLVIWILVILSSILLIWIIVILIRIIRVKRKIKK